MLPTCPAFDVPSLFGRDITLFADFIRLWYNRELKPDTHAGLPWKIVYPTDFLPVANGSQMKVFDRFTDDLASYVDAEVKRVSIKNTWAENPPPEAEDRSLRQYLHNVSDMLTSVS